MNRNTLKYIAIIAMTIDHIGAYLISNPYLYLICRFIGRITFPIMCFFISQGYKYTSNRLKYGLRLFVFALISQIPFTLLKNGTLLTSNFFLELNTIFTLFFSYLFICVFNLNTKSVIKIILLILATLPCLLCDYSIIGLIYVLFFYFINEKQRKLFLPILYLTSTAINILINNTHGLDIIYTIIINLGLLLTVPLFYLYKNKTEKKNIINKYFFYIYYPTHLFIIFLINLF